MKENPDEELKRFIRADSTKLKQGFGIFWVWEYILDKLKYSRVNDKYDAMKIIQHIVANPDHYRNFSINYVDYNSSENLLHLAVLFGKEELIDYLLENKVTVNQVSKSGNTPLIDACKGRDVNIIRKLLQHGADVNAVNNRGESPILLAILSENFEIVELILAQKNLKIEQNSIGSRTPLQVAFLSKKPDICKTVKDILIFDKKLSVNGVSCHGETILHMALQYNRADLVKLLLNMPEIDIRLRDNELNNFMHFAVKSENIQLVELGKEKGFDINLPNNFLQTPLHFIYTRLFDQQFYNDMIKLGANPRLQDKQGRTALDYYNIAPSPNTTQTTSTTQPSDSSTQIIVNPSSAEDANNSTKRKKDDGETEEKTENSFITTELKRPRLQEFNSEGLKK